MRQEASGDGRRRGLLVLLLWEGRVPEAETWTKVPRGLRAVLREKSRKSPLHPQIKWGAQVP